MNYYLFAGSAYYPDGGVEDLKCASTDLEEILKAFRKWGTSSGLAGGWWAHICYGERLMFLATVESCNGYSVEEFLDKWVAAVPDLQKQVDQLNLLAKKLFL